MKLPNNVRLHYSAEKTTTGQHSRVLFLLSAKPSKANQSKLNVSSEANEPVGNAMAFGTELSGHNQ
jgi:hypothetical protein